ncbi:MAG: GlsB/YeaQ/YmgE family stress response membrane protein [Acidimicrobiia bacterium]|nr:GlsB/YeaQ/YmgE family stress response membrane protein [Acidimicrobiia bacterium]
MIGAILLGLVAGAIARALVPNDAFSHMSGPLSWLVSIVLGLAGAWLGWWLFTGVFGIGDAEKFDFGGIVGAIVGAVIVVWGTSFALKLARR